MSASPIPLARSVASALPAVSALKLVIIPETVPSSPIIGASTAKVFK